MANEMAQRIREACRELELTLVAKNQDYGNSALQRPRLSQALSAVDGILVRMSDKFSRLERLRAGARAEVQESLEDTARDIVGYSVLLLLAVEDELFEATLHAEVEPASRIDTGTLRSSFGVIGTAAPATKHKKLQTAGRPGNNRRRK